jgi:hypothetical protein
MVRTQQKQMLACDILHHLNSTHINIKFTTEPEKDKTLPVLDVFIKARMDGSLGHQLYRILIYTDLYLCAKSAHHPLQNCYQQSTSAHQLP